MGTREYWIGSTYVKEWDVTDTDGAPVTVATVTGTVATPTGALVPMTVAHTDGSSTWRLSYPAAVAGRHGYRATAVAAGVADAVSGAFTVSRDTTGAAPITVDTATAVGQVRLLTTDVDEAFPLHTDADLEAFLTMEGNVKRAAAASLETIATSETLVAKKITTQDLSTDGPAVAKDLRERAALLRKQAEQEETGETGDSGYGFGFDYVPAPTTYPGWW